MSDRYAYNPSVCDNDTCPIDCEHCGKSDSSEGDDEEVEIQHVGYSSEECGYAK
jgi:MoaA/NifB/PqqE/SkfB family radical SAM enzyme